MELFTSHFSLEVLPISTTESTSRKISSGQKATTGLIKEYRMLLLGSSSISLGGECQMRNTMPIKDSDLTLLWDK